MSCCDGPEIGGERLNVATVGDEIDSEAPVCCDDEMSETAREGEIFTYTCGSCGIALAVRAGLVWDIRYPASTAA